METKHTKGEWSVFPLKASHAVQVVNKEHQCIATANNYCGSIKIAEANAKLIAASPDLLEALLIAHDIIALRQPERPELNIIKNAINKAIK